jgi:aldehyde dehydrogenase (NAD+)
MPNAILEKLHLTGEQAGAGSGTWLECAGLSAALTTPVTGGEIGRMRYATRDEYEKVVRRAGEAFQVWREVPAPRRGEVVRQIGQALRAHKDDLAALVSLETGKIREEGAGEIQEMIDIADFAVGQSRMLYGLSLHSERPRHRMFEQWHPLGAVGVVTAFNFPAAVWAWNAMLALVAGDTVIWKPSSKAALTAVAVMRTVWPVLAANGLPEGILNLVIGSRDDIGEALLHDPRVPLVSATGSVAMGRRVAQVVAGRLGRSLLELGGNNGVVVTPRADLPMAVRAIAFGAVGTAGQRCTSIRRLIAHEEVYERLVGELTRVYARIPVGNPLEDGVLMGPLIDRGAVAAMQAALEKLAAQGGRVLYGGEVLRGGLFDAGTYVRPCLAQATAAMPIVSEETFAPILYVMRYRELEEAIAWHNAVPQGLSSAIFTDDLREAERFLSAAGSDCGIANVNIGTSGAEIGGAFGGEKDTGGGRESGSDAWKAYMRRQTCTVNWSGELPLAQGIRFELD